MAKRTEISNWGNFPKQEAEVIQLSNQKKANDVFTDAPVIPRGNARCYGDAALNEVVVSTLPLKHFLSFDAENGILECESGVLFSKILEFIVPKGFFLPVTPGTKFITVGGAIAADIHGKNHHVDGCFSEFVEQFDLQTAPDTILTCSRAINADLFWETIGGMGLTGIILKATFRLKPIETSYIFQESIKAKNLEEIFSLFEASEDWTYTVAWIDCLKKGKHLGRSILMRGEHAKPSQLSSKQKASAIEIHKNPKLNIPIFFPNFMLNTLGVKAFNFLYYWKQFSRKTSSIVKYDGFFYPLDAIHNWNRIYGKKGFVQYQFVVDKAVGKAAMKSILETIADSGQGSFLAVLKLFGKHNPNAYNSFPVEGYTLALDFKVNSKLFKLIPKLDAIVRAYDGRIYRAKDSLSDGTLTNYVKAENKHFESVQNRRINQTKTQ